MRNFSVHLIGLLSCGLGIVLTILDPQPALAGSGSRVTPTVLAVRKAQPSVVSISSEKKAASSNRWPFSQEEAQKPRVSGMGSGVILDSRGYILTNQHVVDKVQGILVRLHDGSVLQGRVLQQDETMDLALLKVDAGSSLIPIQIGTSADLMVGEDVITIGNAFGYENTVSKGIISQINRNVTLSDEQVYRNLIQTDACINPGNSGGPLINIDGELIGINVAVRAGAQGIGFALPIDDVKVIVTEMMSTRRLAATWHGIIAAERISPEGRSVMVAEVQPGSSAESGGFHTGDQVVKVGSLAITTPLDIERGLLEARPGERVNIVVKRSGQDKDLTLPLDVQPLPKTVPAAVDQVWRQIGLKATPVSHEYVAAVSNKLRGGLYIQAVLAGSPAARANLAKGDILVGMSVGNHHWETIKTGDILYVVKQSEAAGSSSAQYYIVRKNTSLEGVIEFSDRLLSNIRR